MDDEKKSDVRELPTRPTVNFSQTTNMLIDPPSRSSTSETDHIVPLLVLTRTAESSHGMDSPPSSGKESPPAVDSPKKSESPRHGFFSKLLRNSSPNSSSSSLEHASPSSPRLARQTSKRGLGSILSFSRSKKTVVSRPETIKIEPAQQFSEAASSSSCSPLASPKNEYLSVAMGALVPDVETDIWRETRAFEEADGASFFLTHSRKLAESRGARGLRSASALSQALQSETNELLYPQKSLLMVELTVLMDTVLNPLYVRWYTQNEVDSPADRRPIYLYFQRLVRELMLSNKLSRHEDEAYSLDKGASGFFDYINIQRAELKLCHLRLLIADIPMTVLPATGMLPEAIAWFKQEIAHEGNQELAQRLRGMCEHLQILMMKMDDIEAGIALQVAQLRDEIISARPVILGYHSFKLLLLNWLASTMIRSPRTTVETFEAGCSKMVVAAVQQSIIAISEIFNNRPNLRYVALLNPSTDRNFYLSENWAGEIQTALKTLDVQMAYKHYERFIKSIAACVTNKIEYLVVHDQTCDASPSSSSSLARSR